MNAYVKSGTAQRGFTLIELVVVIVILGILAAFAVPKFMGLEAQARASSVRALEGTLRSSAAMAHGVWLASGSPNTITIDGNTITMTNGYPNTNSLQNIIDPSIVGTDPGKFTQAGGRFRINGARTPANCQVTYANATAAAPPTITPVVTNCN